MMLDLFDKFGNSLHYSIPMPSEKLIDGGSVVPIEKRRRIIDIAAKYVDNNVFGTRGRPAMCEQFSILVKHMLLKEGIQSEIKTGKARYIGNEVDFTWEHFWLETEHKEIVDCNVDSMPFHFDVPEGIAPYNYWGNSDNLPSDRVFSQVRTFSADELAELESEDDETVLWKKGIDNEY